MPLAYAHLYCRCTVAQETEMRYLGKTQNAASSGRKNGERDWGITCARATKITGRKRKWIRYNAGWRRRSSVYAHYFCAGYPRKDVHLHAIQRTHVWSSTCEEPALASEMHGLHVCNAYDKCPPLYTRIHMKYCRCTGCRLNKTTQKTYQLFR